MVRKGEIGPRDQVRLGLIGRWIPAPDILSPEFVEPGSIAQVQAPDQPMKPRRISLHALIIGVLAAGAVAAAIAWMFRAATPRPVTPRAICSANLLLLARGIGVYTKDYDLRLPHWQTWMPATRAYVRAPDAYECPAAREGELSYDFNAALSGVRLQEIARASTGAMIWDAGALGPSRAIPGGHGPPRHDGGDNFLFVDGHVEWRQRSSNVDVPAVMQPRSPRSRF